MNNKNWNRPTDNCSGDNLNIKDAGQRIQLTYYVYKNKNNYSHIQLANLQFADYQQY